MTTEISTKRLSPRRRTLLEKAIVEFPHVPNEFEQDLAKDLIEMRMITMNGDGAINPTKRGLKRVNALRREHGLTPLVPSLAGREIRRQARASIKRKTGKEIDSRLAERYNWYVKGSIKPTEEVGKWLCKIKCQETGEHRTVFAQDVFQVRYTEEVTFRKRNERRAAAARKTRREMKKGKKA